MTKSSITPRQATSITSGNKVRVSCVDVSSENISLVSHAVLLYPVISKGNMGKSEALSCLACAADEI